MNKYVIKSLMSGLITIVISKSRMKALSEARAYFGTNQVRILSMQQAPTKTYNNSTDINRLS